MSEAIAAVLAEASREGRPVRPCGGATKAAWGTPTGEAASLPAAPSDIREHNAGDLTAVVGAGTRLADLQEAVGRESQMLALDPPLGPGEKATLGGVLATNDSGPLRHRHGSARDLVVGVRVALADGSQAKAGGKVIKNVAGYDLAKLFTGSFGALGVVTEVSVRLHPVPSATATAVGHSDDPAALATAALELAHAPLELHGLDVRWERGEGALLARLAGADPSPAAADAARAMGEHGLEAEAPADDERLREEQRAAQRSDDGAVVRVSGLPGRLERLLRAADELGARLVGRAGLGLSWVTLPRGGAQTGLAELRRAMAPSPCVVLDCPSSERQGIDVWGPRDPGALELMRRVKERFDPAGVCAPGVLGL